MSRFILLLLLAVISSPLTIMAQSSGGGGGGGGGGHGGHSSYDGGSGGGSCDGSCAVVLIILAVVCGIIGICCCLHRMGQGNQDIALSRQQQVQWNQPLLPPVTPISEHLVNVDGGSKSVMTNNTTPTPTQLPTTQPPHNGLWQGSYTGTSLNNNGTFPMYMHLYFSGTAVTGHGYDGIGSFRIEGETRNHMIGFWKVYVSQPKVKYQGNTVGTNNLYGRWTLANGDAGTWKLIWNAQAQPHAQLPRAQHVPLQNMTPPQPTPLRAPATEQPYTYQPPVFHEPPTSIPSKV